MKYIIFLFIPFLVFSQKIKDSYPRYQTPYVGGYEQYYKDFHDIIVEKKLQPCENKDELYLFSVVVYPDGKINMVKEHNIDHLNKNKCAYELAREVAKYQKGWNPASFDGIKEPTVARFNIYPDDLFEKYKEGYLPQIIYPSYGNYKNNGAEEFRKGIVNRIDLRGFRWDDIFVVIAEFIITKDGNIENPQMIRSSGLEEFDKRIINAIKSTRKKWKPGSINGKPVDIRYRLSLTGTTD